MKAPKLNWTPSRGQYSTTIDGKFRLLGADQAEAERRFRFLLTKADLAEPANPGVTFGEVADAWLDHVGAVMDGERFRLCKGRINDFLAHLGRDIRVKDMRPAHVEGWIASRPRLKAAGTKRLYKAMILAALNWGASKKVRMIVDNPLKGRIHLPEDESRGGNAGWTPEIFRAVLAETNPEFGDLLTALAGTGCRPSTLRRVEARHYRPGLKLWDVEDLYAGRASKRKYVRRVWLSDDVIPLVERLNEKWPAGPIFRNTLGRPYTPDVITMTMYKLKDRMKRKGTPLPADLIVYSLRHNFATQFIVRHPDKLEYLRELLGHRDLTMIRKHYSKLFDEHRAMHDSLKDFRPLG